MKKLLGLCLAFIFTVLVSYSKDLKFVQIDGLKYNPNNQSSVDSFKDLVSKINNEKNLSFVIFSGDNISKPDKDYLRTFFKASKKLKAPVYFALGNKELNKNKGLGKESYVKTFDEAFPFQRKIKAPSYVFEKCGIVFIVPDGSKEFLATQNGYYKAETIEWIDKKLDKYKDKNVIIIQHFPIIPPSEKEGYQTYKADEYIKMLSGKTNVKAIISGHYGVNNEITTDGILHISTENFPKYRVLEIIDCETSNPLIWSTVKE